MVVMAVAMLLTALTMPAMKQVHENAQRVACMSNLQQLGHAFIMYGGDHNDWLPTSEAQANNETPQNLMMSRRSATSQGAGWDGIGLLFEENYCSAPECFYCPSHRGNHPLERYAAQWRDPSSSLPIFTNYHYAGFFDWKSNARRRSLLDGYDLVLATDGLRTTSDFNHTVGMNVLRGDGSVRWRDDNNNILGMLPKTELEHVTPGYFNLWDMVAER